MIYELGKWEIMTQEDVDRLHEKCVPVDILITKPFPKEEPIVVELGPLVCDRLASISFERVMPVDVDFNPEDHDYFKELADDLFNKE